MLYFVGGIVRDLLLGQDIVDIDLVVEGDAIQLGETMEAQLRRRDPQPSPLRHGQVAPA